MAGVSKEMGVGVRAIRSEIGGGIGGGTTSG